MLNKARLGKVEYEKRVTWLYFSVLPLFFGILSAVTFPYGNLSRFWAYPFFVFFVIFFIFTFPRFFICNINFLQVEFHIAEVKTNDIVVMRSGPNGSGKTSSQAYDSVVLRDKKEFEAECDFRHWRGLVAQWRREGNLEMLARWDEVKFSRKYYARYSQTHIPYLWSTIKIEIDGRVSYDLTLRHLIQQKRIPGYSVLCHDDSGASLPAKLSGEGEVPPELDYTFRYMRHWHFIMLTNDQRATNMVIGGRSVVAKNIVMKEMKNVCEARFFMWLKDKLLNRLLRLPVDTPKVYPRLNRLIFWLNEMINTIGFRRYTIAIVSGTESESKDKEKKQKYYVPRNLNCRYESRSYMQCYEALGQEMERPAYSSSLFVNPATYDSDNMLVNEMYAKKQEPKESRISRRERAKIRAKAAAEAAIAESTLKA